MTTELTWAEAEAIWREHGRRAWDHFRTAPTYRVERLRPPDISFRNLDGPARMTPREVITITHEVEDIPTAGRRGWRVKVCPWIVA